ncbi:MAG TPA: amidohydrolase family protein, partial [bacterium]|nr:amidohydrolase family protein [bacterium]
LGLLDRFPRLMLDTAMVFTRTDVFDTTMKIDPARLLPYRERILFGSDFPNIPYDYSEAVDSILRLGLGDEFNRLVFRDNALRVFGLEEPPAA